MDKYYKIAGLTVRMDTFGRTLEQAKPYLCAATDHPDMIIRSHGKALEEKYPALSADDCEYLSTGAVFYQHLLEFDGFRLHSSAVVVDGQAYLFTATSGTGKSTHTRLWLEKFGERAYILNDDKPALRLEEGIWYAYGTPWSGKHDLSRDARVPVAGIAVLERGAENIIQPFGGIEAVYAIVRQANRPKAAQYRTKLLELLDQLITRVPVWKLQCNMEPEAADVSYAAMSKKEK